ncbi:MAG: D-alanyl-D-alanine carboxypeptidase [Clostridia bacterium]|nr:D-alanyl-D-alanine carboxypeptidase [Clostridia bacterium]
MKKLCALILILCLLAGMALSEEMDIFKTPSPEAEDQKCAYIPRLAESPLMDAPPFHPECAAVMLVEPESGQVIFEMNADSPRQVASITKIMTILLTLEAIEGGRISPEQTTVISKNASGMGGSQVLLDTGETQSVDVLLKSMIVGSANDASVALAEMMYGSEEICVDKMNARAKELGMVDTVFVNCTGLPAEGQHTTARDTAIMTMAMLHHDLYFKYSGIWMDEVRHEEGRITQLTNTNKLIRLLDGCDGGKTGSTNEAGYCISATAKRGNMRLIAVVLGAKSGSERFSIASEMINYGFANYHLYPVATRGTKVKGAIPVEGGEPDSITLLLDGDLTLLMEKGSGENIALIPEVPEILSAPIEKGSLIGHVRVDMGGNTIARLPLIAECASKVHSLSAGFERIWKNWGCA